MSDVLYILASSKVPNMAVLGAQDRLPQDTPQWHSDYFELKLLEKELVETKDIKKHSDLPLPQESEK